MDTTGFFNYPTLGGSTEPAPDPGFLPHATVEEWDAVLGATETLRFHPGDVVLRAGEHLGQPQRLDRRHRERHRRPDPCGEEVQGHELISEAPSGAMPSLSCRAIASKGAWTLASLSK